MAERQLQPPDSLGNFSDKKNNSYVVGIPLSPSTLYVDHPSDNNRPPNGDPRSKRSASGGGTSFQITSVTVQGHRLNNDEWCDDSADDYEDSHTDDISSDILDSSRFTEPDGYQSEDNLNNNNDDMSPCGPLIITPFATTTTTSSNVGLGIDMSPPFSAPNGVTMMTSSSESPVSAQVLPDNWQHRFKVVKIVSSEPFRRGRWTCMDFRDPPAPQLQHVSGDNNNGDLPSIQVTPSSQDVVTRAEQEQLNKSVAAHVYEIPVNSQPNQPIYGIFLPQYINENIVQYGGVANVHQLPAAQQGLVDPKTLVGGIVPTNSDAVTSSASAFQCPQLDGNANKLEPYPIVNGHDPHVAPDGDRFRDRSYSAECTESICTLASQLCRTSGLQTNSNISQWPQFESRPTTLTNSLDQQPILPQPLLPSVEGVYPSSEVPNLATNLLTTVTTSRITANPLLPPPTFATDSPPLPPCFTVTVPAAAITCVPPVGHALCPSSGVESIKSAASTGASTVAIDNKIEQAMDLVKSHLMFAVREEVEVLKEKITELLERISQLEHENDILRANASPETLKQLNQSQKKKFSVINNKTVTNQQNQPPAS